MTLLLLDDDDPQLPPNQTTNTVVWWPFSPLWHEGRKREVSGRESVGEGVELEKERVRIKREILWWFHLSAVMEKFSIVQVPVLCLGLEGWGGWGFFKGRQLPIYEFLLGLRLSLFLHLPLVDSGHMAQQPLVARLYQVVHIQSETLCHAFHWISTKLTYSTSVWDCKKTLNGNALNPMNLDKHELKSDKWVIQIT